MKISNLQGTEYSKLSFYPSPLDVSMYCATLARGTDLHHGGVVARDVGDEAARAAEVVATAYVFDLLAVVA